jgi:hypothetical protein
MQRALRASSLVPPGFAVIGTESEGGKTIIVVRSTGGTSQCPSCGVDSRQIHSHYRRQIADLPMAGRSVELVAYVRRFRCSSRSRTSIGMSASIFASPMSGSILSRRRHPLDVCLLDHGGERLLGKATRLQKARKVAAFAQLGDA